MKTAWLISYHAWRILILLWALYGLHKYIKYGSLIGGNIVGDLVLSSATGLLIFYDVVLMWRAFHDYMNKKYRNKK